jgi:hypothetical protein
MTAATLAAQQPTYFAELAGLGLPRELKTTVAVALGDIDRDGDLDLVNGVAWLFPGKPIELLLNDGGGRFDAAPAGLMPGVANATAALVTVDIDGDGDLDAVVANRDHQQNRLFVNDGTGRFNDATAVALPVASDDTRSLVAGDLDLDGDMDLLFGNDGAPFGLYLNDGRGVFVPGGSIQTTTRDTPAVLALEDVDGDGSLDLFVGNAVGQNRLYINDGSARFIELGPGLLPADSDQTTAAAFFDLEGDGDRDLIIGNYGGRNRIYANDGTGRFADRSQQRLPTDTDQTLGVVAEDFDADGDVDILFANWSAPSRLLLNDGYGFFQIAQAGSFPTSVGFAQSIAAGDIDGDGDVDAVMGTGRSVFAPSRNALLINVGQARFVNATAVAWSTADSNTTSIAVGDVDLDSDADVIVGVEDGSNQLWLNDGRGRYSPAPAGQMPTDSDVTRAVSLGDLDGDQDLDLVIGNSGQNRIYVNFGNGRFLDLSQVLLPPGDEDTTSVVLRDVDGDGDLDLLATNAGLSPRFSQQNRLYRNDGLGFFTDVTVTSLPVRNDYSFGAAVGDVDGDGDVDVVIANWTINNPPNPIDSNRLLLNDGRGVFVDAPRGMLPEDLDPSTTANLADVDNDGDLDLLIGNFGASPRLYVNDGFGGFTDRPDLLSGAAGPTRSMTVADVDGDGDVDVVLGNTDAQNWLLINDGTGRFTDVTALAMPQAKDFTMCVVLADCDGDEDPDLFVGNQGRQHDYLYKNLLREIDSPFLAVTGAGYVIDVYSRPTPTIGIAAQIWLSFRTVPKPLQLPPFGAFRLDPSVLFDLGAFAIPGATGVGSMKVVIPRDPNLIGRDFFLQALVFDPTNLLAARLSNLDHDVFR